MHSIAIADFVVVMFTFITVATATDVKSECETMKMPMAELKITTVTMLKWFVSSITTVIKVEDFAIIHLAMKIIAICFVKITLLSLYQVKKCLKMVQHLHQMDSLDRMGNYYHYSYIK